jgi:hypothetical protein
MVIAVADSVTVSMAALTIGMFILIFRVRKVETSTSSGRTSDLAGIRIRSSNV